jgi:hypothetical protein
MQRALVVCLFVASGCSTPSIDVASERAAIKPATSCEHVQCKPRHDDHDPKRAACCVQASATIDASGGIVTTGDGTTVEVPLGAVAGTTTITIHESETPAPKGAVTPIISFGPDGIVFAHPVKVTIPLARTTGHLTTFWTSHDGSGRFVPVGGTVVGDNMVVEVTHFSEGYVAEDPGVRSVSATALVTYVSDATEIFKPDLTAPTIRIEALIPDGSGGYTSIQGTGSTDGHFEIDGIPVGPALIHTSSPANLYTMLDVTDNTSVDLSRALLGRRLPTIASDTSNLVFEVDDMTAWQDGDTMEFFCPQNNDWIFGLETFGLFNFPTAGATSIQDMVLREPLFLPGGGARGNLIEAAHDTCTLLHMQSRQTADDMAPVTYLATVETFNPAPFDQLDGTDTLVQGRFSHNDTPNRISVDLQMQKYVEQFGPDPASIVRSIPGAAFFISGLWADAAGVSASASSADFLGIDVTANPVRTVARDMRYGLSLAGNWQPFGSAGYSTSLGFPVPGTPRAAVFTHQIFTSVDVSNPNPDVLIDIEPRLGPPGALLVAGLDALQPQTGVGLTPTVSWTAPTLGAANLYELDVFQLTPTTNRRNFVNAGRFATTGTSLTLPPDVLEAGGSYVLIVQAGIAKPIAQNPVPPATVAPFNANLTDGANIVSAIIQP